MARSANNLEKLPSAQTESMASKINLSSTPEWSLKASTFYQLCNAMCDELYWIHLHCRLALSRIKILLPKPLWKLNDVSEKCMKALAMIVERFIQEVLLCSFKAAQWIRFTFTFIQMRYSHECILQAFNEHDGLEMCTKLILTVMKWCERVFIWNDSGVKGKIFVGF